MRKLEEELAKSQQLDDVISDSSGYFARNISVSKNSTTRWPDYVLNLYLFIITVSQEPCPMLNWEQA